MNILSLQSAVAYGYVGNSAARFALQRMGHTVWPIDTVAFSNHPEYGRHTGRFVPASELRALIDGLEARGALSRCDALLSGYLGEADSGAVALHTVARLREANPQALYALDPVIGDTRRGVYVRPGLPEFFRDHAVATADLVLPNAFELAFLTGTEITGIGGALAAARKLLQKGPRLVVVKSIPDGERFAALAVEAGRAWRIAIPRVQAPTQGAGDAFSAIFLGRYLSARNTADALVHATSALYGILRRTAELQLDYLALIEAQREIVEPSQLFEAVAL